MIKILRFIPVQLTVFLIVGILIGSYWDVKPVILFVVLAILLVLLGLSFYFSNRSYKRNLFFNAIAYSVCVVVGVLTANIQNDLLKISHYSHFIDQKPTIELVVDEVLKPSLFHDKYVVSIQKLDTNIVSGKVLLNVVKDSLVGFEVDDRVYLKGSFTKVNKPLNPYYFDYREYLSRKQIHHQITVYIDAVLLLPSKKKSFYGMAAKFRKRVQHSLEKQGFLDNELAVMNALLLGQRNEISKKLLQSYANAGAIHILALSGLHVGIILLMLNFILKPLERSRRGGLLKLILIIVFLWSFAFVAGMSSSIVRAVTMFTAVAIGWQSKRPTNVRQSLVMSMFILLLIRPNFLFEVGFQLSYLAVFSIIWIQPMLYKIWKPKLKVVNYFWQLLTVSVAAQFGILPLSLFYFHQFPGLFFVTNLILIPFLGVILGGGFLVIGLSLLDVLPSFLYKFYEYLIEMMNAVIEWVSLLEAFLFQNIPLSLLKMLVVYVLIVSTISFLDHRNYKRLMFLLVSVLIVQAAFLFERNLIFSEAELVFFHKSRETILANKKGTEVSVFHTLDSSSLYKENILRQYKLGKGNVDMEFENEMPKVTKFKNHKILIIDSLGVYQIPKFKPELILLRGSPKINLDRVIELLQPKKIIADGSNYKSYVKRWEKTSVQKNTPFHYTGQKGAFILKK